MNSFIDLTNNVKKRHSPFTSLFIRQSQQLQSIEPENKKSHAIVIFRLNMCERMKDKSSLGTRSQVLVLEHFSSKGVGMRADLNV